MSLFNRNRTSEEQQNYESYMTGYRLGFPVDEDAPGVYDPNNPEFRRGLTDGVNGYQDNQAFLAEHAEELANEEEEEKEEEEEEEEEESSGGGGFISWLLGAR